MLQTLSLFNVYSVGCARASRTRCVQFHRLAADQEKGVKHFCPASTWQVNMESHTQESEFWLMPQLLGNNKPKKNKKAASRDKQVTLFQPAVHTKEKKRKGEGRKYE